MASTYYAFSPSDIQKFLYDRGYIWDYEAYDFNTRGPRPTRDTDFIQKDKEKPIELWAVVTSNGKKVGVVFYFDGINFQLKDAQNTVRNFTVMWQNHLLNNYNKQYIDFALRYCKIRLREIFARLLVEPKVKLSELERQLYKTDNMDNFILVIDRHKAELTEKELNDISDIKNLRYNCQIKLNGNNPGIKLRG